MRHLVHPRHRPDEDDADYPGAYNGELSLVVGPPERTVRGAVGEGASRLVSRLLWRVREVCSRRSP